MVARVSGKIRIRTDPALIVVDMAL